MQGCEKLHQLLAVEKGTKSETYKKLNDLNKLIQKTDLFDGFNRNYAPLNDGDITYPNESKKVQLNTSTALNQLKELLVPIIDITATKDRTNCVAYSDIVLEDGTVIKEVPATFLLYLEKQMNDLKTFIENLKVLDSSETWKYDEVSGMYMTDNIKTHKTKKELKVLVKYEATNNHPAQTETYTEDCIVGFWNSIKLSGAMPYNEKMKLLSQLEKLSNSIKIARETANTVPVIEKKVGDQLFEYLFK